MNDSPSVSIILAAYNAETYLRRAIDGILAQTLSDFEVLLVDDGSTDRTPTICEEYAQKDARFRVFHEQHQGVAYARQVGIDNARGRYTINVDVDDHFETAMLEEMYQTAEQEEADLLICDYWEQNKKGKEYHSQKPTVLAAKEVTNDIVEGKLYGALWNKLIRTTCYRDNRICFRQELTMREDLFFIFDLMPYIRYIAYLPKAFYTYNKTSNNCSLTNTYLIENRNYYEQEILWHLVALGNTMVGDIQKERLRNALLNDAYITLSGRIFSKDEWQKTFSRYHQYFDKATPLYKKLLVIMALNGHYRFSSSVRRMLAKMKGTI